VTAEQPPPEEFTYDRGSDMDPKVNVLLIAIVAFVIGIGLNGYIALSILDDGGSSGSTPSDDAPLIVPAAATAVPSPTATPLPDRTDCAEISGTQYRSPSEREFFLSECINQPEPTPTIDPTQLPPLDGGTNTETATETPSPTPDP